MKVAVFLSCIIGLVCLTQAAAAERKAIDWESFSIEDISSLEDPSKNVYLIHFVGETCDSVCSKDRSMLAKYAGEFKKIDPNVQVKSARLSKEGAKSLSVNESSAIFIIYHGHLLRVDNNGPVKHEKSVEDNIKNVLSKKPSRISLVSELKNVFFNKDRAYVFYGDEKSRYWRDVAIVAQMMDHEIYFTTNRDVASELNLKKKNKFYLACKLGLKTARLHGRPEKPSILKFIEISSQPLPGNFSQSLLERAVAKGYAILFIKTNGSDTESVVNEILTKHDELIRPHSLVMNFTDLADPEQKKVFDYCTPEGTPRDNVLCIVDYLQGHSRPPRYLFKKKIISEINLVNFILDFVDGELKPHEKVQRFSSKFSAKIRNLNTNTLPSFLSLSENAMEFMVLHFPTSETTLDDLHILEEVSIEFKDANLKFGRYNLDLNEPLKESEGLYFGGAWNNSNLIKYEGEWTNDSIKSWIADLVKEQVRAYNLMNDSSDL